MSSPTSLPPITPVTADEPEAMSADPVASNVQALKALFPDAFSEGGVDFDTLRQLLGDAVDDGEEKYGLNWNGKRRARRLALTPSLGTLLPAPEDSVDWDTTKNLMIEGDNLEVLKLLQKSYAGKVKLIYIDPPYNTGKDFVYPDDYADSLGNYLRRTGQRDAEGVRNSSNSESSGRYHTDWLNMMMPRLMLARNLMTKDGCIIVSIDETEVDNLRGTLNIVFGEQNFLGTVVLQTATDNNPTQVATEHEYMLVYARDAGEVGPWGRPSEKAARIVAEHDRLRKEIGPDNAAIQSALRAWIRKHQDELDGVTHYDNVDDKGVFHDGDVANTKFGGYHYAVPHPITGKTCKIPAKGFRFPEATMKRMIADGDIMFGEDETTLIKPKKRAKTVTELLRSIIYEDGRSSTKRLDTMMARGVFDNPKSETILSRLVELASSTDAIILDFFAGSGTTGHAVMAQNAADSGRRRYILVQLPEPLDPENKDQKTAADFCDTIDRPRNIAELTKERLRRSATKVQADHSGATFDGGFRVYKLAASNLKAWQPGADLEADLLSAADNLVPGRTEDDLLVELLLKRGIDLAEPSQTREIGGRTVHAFGGGVMLTCLGDVRVADAEALADGMADWVEELVPVAPTMIFFKDAGFENDVAKTNVAKILDQRLNGRGPGEAHLLEAVRSV